MSLPSRDVPEAVKRSYTEADVHSKLFELDMITLGFPPRTSTQADGEYFLEQRRLALRRLQSRTDRQRHGHYDGLYLIGNNPIVLCEIKRFDALGSPTDVKRAEHQMQSYATSDDFRVPPPFLLLYAGDPTRARFYRRKTMLETPFRDGSEYELTPELWDWERIKDAHAKGEFAEEIVDRQRLLEILLHHLDQIEDDIRGDMTQAVAIAAAPEPPELLSQFGRWLCGHREALRRMQALYQRKVAELDTERRQEIIEEMVTQAALNYLNKVFFLSLCEDRNLPGFYRIMREFLPHSRTETSPTTATVFLTLLRRKIRDTSGAWQDEEEAAYQALRSELASDIRDHVIEQNNWWELIRVAFDLAVERFPLIYHEDAYDYFRPGKERLAELVYDLSTKSFKALTNRHVGDIYQGLLSSRRQGGAGPGGRRRQQAKLGAFYTPDGDVRYMVSRLGLEREARVLDPCMGSGHFLEGVYDALAEEFRAEGYSSESAYRAVVSHQLYGGDIDTFATSLAAIRLFLLDEHASGLSPNLFVHDMLLHSPERPGAELFTPEVLETEGRERAVAERAAGNSRHRTQQEASPDPVVDEPAAIDEISFDAVVGNPPYGARKPAYKRRVYARLYGTSQQDLRAGSVGTGDGDSYAMFFANGIERLREGGRLCLITNDSFRSLTTHARLRRHILDRCKIVEILLTDTKHFEGVSFQFAGMAITTLEKCSNAVDRASHVMRLVDYMRNPGDFSDPPTEKVMLLRQAEYEALPETPFFVGVPDEVFEAAKRSARVADVARGRVGLQTSDDRFFLAGVGHVVAGLHREIDASKLASGLTEHEREHGVAPGRAHWVPFAKGEGYGEYWRPPGVAIDWSERSVADLKRRDKLPAGTRGRPRFQNRKYYFKPGLTYSVVSSGRLSVRLMPEGWIFGHKGSAIFVEDEGTSERFLLGYLNSSLATYFMKRLVNTTATADIGYVEKLPYRRPDPLSENTVIERVEQIVSALQVDPDADIDEQRRDIDDTIFDLFEIRDTREHIRRFYREVGLAERLDDQAGAGADANE